MLRSSLLVLALSTSAAIAAIDPPPPEDPLPSVATKTTKTRGFVGFNWSFGPGGGPEAVVGVTRVKVKDNGNAQGAKLSFHMPISNGITFGKVKLTGVFGKENRMGEIGVGYGFGTGSAFLTTGIWAPYVNGGFDFDFNGTFNGYAGFNSLKKWSVPAAGVGSGELPGDDDT